MKISYYEFVKSRLHEKILLNVNYNIVILFKKKYDCYWKKIRIVLLKEFFLLIENIVFWICKVAFTRNDIVITNNIVISFKKKIRFYWKKVRIALLKD